MATNHGSIEFLKFPNPQFPGDRTKLIKKWLRDSWARRKIAALQQAVSAIVVPTKTSDLTNDSDFQTGTQVGNAISAEAGLMVPYGYCTIAAGTVAKTVTVSPAVTALTAGLCIAVKFQYANTATNPTLNVNGLGAKAIKRYGTTAAGTSAAANWNANSVVMLVYDGTYWMLADWNNTTYSGMSDAEYQAGTSTTNRLITPARLKAAIELHAPVKSVNGATGDVTVTVPTKTSDIMNDSGFITSAPVTSVNGQTGAVNLDASDVGALSDTTVIPSKTSDLTNDSGYITSSKFAVISGTLASAAGNSAEVTYPTGFTADNCVALSLMVNYSSQWRYVGDGVLGQSGRLYVLMKSTGVVVYNSLNYGFNQDWKAVLMRTDI